MNTSLKCLSIAFGLTVALITGASYAGQASIPNKFAPGIAANSAKVNANFNNLKVSIDDNDSRIAAAEKRFVVVDNNDLVIGLGIEPASDGEIHVVTPTGFSTLVQVKGGRISDQIILYYTDSNCGVSGGKPYMDYVGNLFGGDTVSDDQDSRTAGAVYNIVAYTESPNPPPSAFWYLKKVPTLINNLSVQSILLYDFLNNTIICDSVTGGVLTIAAEMTPNNPTVTGIPDSGFPAAPIRIDYR